MRGIGGSDRTAQGSPCVLPQPVIDVGLECHVEKDSEAKSGFPKKETVIDE